MASKLRVDSILPVDGAPTSGGGGIIQVVSTTLTTPTSTTSTSAFEDISGLSVAITPKFSTSKVLLMVSLGSLSTNAQSMGFRFLRGSTQIGGATSTANQSGFTNVYAAAAFIMSAYHNFLDSPSTTSATTYKLQWRVASGTGYLGQWKDSTTDYNGSSTITAMEVSA